MCSLTWERITAHVLINLGANNYAPGTTATGQATWERPPGSGHLGAATAASGHLGAAQVTRSTGHQARPVQRGPRNFAPGLGFLRSPAAAPGKKRCIQYGGPVLTADGARITRQVYGRGPGPKNACGPDKAGGHHGRGLGAFDTGQKTGAAENDITGSHKKTRPGGRVYGARWPGFYTFTSSNMSPARVSSSTRSAVHGIERA
jgi:hypothetical protein